MQIGMQFEIDWNGKTVWVNDATGCCIGRFSRFGVDVHKSGDAQMSEGTQCLDCIHDLPPEMAWPRFVASMLKHHGVVIPESACPAFVIARQVSTLEEPSTAHA